MSKCQLLKFDCHLKILSHNISKDHYSMCMCTHETLAAICEFCNCKLMIAVGEISERLKCECVRCTDLTKSVVFMLV